MIDSEKETVSKTFLGKKIRLSLDNKIYNQKANTSSINADTMLSTKDGIEIDTLKLDSKSNSTSSQKIKKGQWTLKEDELLKKWVKENGPKYWDKCGEFFGNRTGKQCREHWLNCLSPDLLKTQWNPKEDFKIFYLYNKCNGSWKEISKFFDGRNENAIKNRFFSQLRKIAIKHLNQDEKKLFKNTKLNDLRNKYFKETFKCCLKELFYVTKMNKNEFLSFLFEIDEKIYNTFNLCRNKITPKKTSQSVFNLDEDMQEAKSLCLGQININNWNNDFNFKDIPNIFNFGKLNSDENSNSELYGKKYTSYDLSNFDNNCNLSISNDFPDEIKNIIKE